MNLTESRYMLDSSTWISNFFAENKEIKTIIDAPNIHLTSIISLFEIKRKLMRDNLETKKMSTILSYIKERSIIAKLEQNICERAAEISLTYKLYAIDALVYTTSLINNCNLVTRDNNFQNLDKVIIIG